MKNKIYNVKIHLQVLNPVVAPAHSIGMRKIIIEKRKLKEKYGEIAEHLDYLFPFAVDDSGRIRPVIKGKTVRGALNYWLGLSGRDYIVENVFLDESNITIETESLTQKSGKKTLCVYEVIIPSAILNVNIYTADRSVVDMLRNSINEIIYIGKWKRKGFGKCRIIRVEILEKDLKLPPK